MARTLPYLGLAASGAALVLAFAPWQAFFLTWLALIPLFAASEWPSSRARLLAGLVFGAGLFGFGLHWLLPTVATFAQMPWPMALPVWLGLVAFCSLFPAAFAWLGGHRRTPGPGAVRYLAFLPALWLALESLRAYFLTGFPWLTLGHAQTAGPLAGLLPVVGYEGAGLAAAVLNGALLGLLRVYRQGRRRGVAAGAVGLLLALGAAQALHGVHWTRPAGSELQAALVQGAIPQAKKWDPSHRETTLERYRRLTAEHLGADVVVWPETAVPLFADQALDYLQALDRHARARGTGLLVGVPERRWRDGEKFYYNALLGLGTASGRYRKRHLVPFGEYVPLSPVLGWAERYLPGGGGFSAGASAQPLRLNGHGLGPTICYEDAFAREVRPTVTNGADVLVNVTNDAWFGPSIGPDQHAQLARIRALEVRRPMLRVANTGRTFAVDPWGRVTASLPREEPGVLRVAVQPRTGATPYSALGPWPAWGLGLAGLVLGLSAARRRG
jgi:apolipoprotein N-acyltransferase